MKHLLALLLLFVLLLVGPAARADVNWGADAYSSPSGAVEEAEAAMGTAFESYSHYSNLTNVQMMTRKSMERSIREHALVYINLNSEAIGKKGHEVPICWSAIAAGNRDTQLHAWTAAILATHYDHFLFTFNHEPMWSSPTHPKCSDRYDNPTTYRAAFNHVRKLFVADGIDAPWAYVMTWGATKWEGGLLYRPAPRNFDVIGTDQYYQCNDASYPPADAFKSFFDWKAQYAPKKPVLVGEIGALSTCPERALTWLNAAKTRLQANDVLAINWNLRTNEDQEYNPLLQDDIRQWWLDWASEETGERAEGAS
jgi:hypothetical protein